MATLRQRAAQGEVRGVAGDSEQTSLEVVTLRELLGRAYTDWTTVGVVMQALVE